TERGPVWGPFLVSQKLLNRGDLLWRLIQCRGSSVPALGIPPRRLVTLHGTPRAVRPESRHPPPLRIGLRRPQATACRLCLLARSLSPPIRGRFRSRTRCVLLRRQLCRSRQIPVRQQGPTTSPLRLTTPPMRGRTLLPLRRAPTISSGLGRLASRSTPRCCLRRSRCARTRQS